MIAQMTPEIKIKTSIMKRKDRIASDFNLETLYASATSKDTPVFAISGAAIRRQFREIKKYLPTVNPHFAIKSLPQSEVIETLRQENAYFDLASIGEIELVKSVGIAPEHCIFTHPFKTKSQIEQAIDFGIKTFVVDSESELKKMEAYKDQVQLFIRLSFPNEEAKCDLSSKFGIAPKKALYLVLLAKNLGLKVIGTSFHVGSQTTNSEPFIKALEFCKKFYHQVKKYDIKFTTLNIGGGFPTQYDDQCFDHDEYFDPIHQFLTQHFSEYDVISEPGRFISAPAGLLICKVIGKNHRNDKLCYYLNDGVYGIQSGRIFEKADYPIFTPADIENDIEQLYPCTLYGPTCDCVDKIGDDIYLPELALDDLIVMSDIGAYSIASSTNFNFLGKVHINFQA